MSKFEKLVYVGCPWFFGMVLVVVALLNTSEMETVGSGMICMSLFCVCSLLVKLVENKKNWIILGFLNPPPQLTPNSTS